MAPRAFVIVVGASLAGAKAAEALRGHGFDGRNRRRAGAHLRVATAVQGISAGQPGPRHDLRPLGTGYTDQAVDLRVDTNGTELHRDRRLATLSGGQDRLRQAAPGHGRAECLGARLPQA